MPTYTQLVQFLKRLATTSSFDQNLSATTEPVRRDLSGFLHAFSILSPGGGCLQRKI
jgi:hypothetical protein